MTIFGRKELDEPEKYVISLTIEVYEEDEAEECKTHLEYSCSKYWNLLKTEMKKK